MKDLQQRGGGMRGALSFVSFSEGKDFLLVRNLKKECTRAHCIFLAKLWCGSHSLMFIVLVAGGGEGHFLPTTKIEASICAHPRA